MNRRPALLALAAAVLLAAAQGCHFSADPAVSPVQKVIAANQAYTTTLRVLTDLRRQGRIDDATAQRIELARKIAAGALDDAETAVRAGDRFKLDATLTAFADALAELDRAASRAQSGVPNNGT